MTISLEEVIPFAETWFHAVQNGADANAQAKFHRFSDAKIIAPDGTALNLEQHMKRGHPLA